MASDPNSILSLINLIPSPHSPMTSSIHMPDDHDVDITSSLPHSIQPLFVYLYPRFLPFLRPPFLSFSFSSLQTFYKKKKKKKKNNLKVFKHRYPVLLYRRVSNIKMGCNCGSTSCGCSGPNDCTCTSGSCNCTNCGVRFPLLPISSYQLTSPFRNKLAPSNPTRDVQIDGTGNSSFIFSVKKEREP